MPVLYRHSFGRGLILPAADYCTPDNPRFVASPPLNVQPISVWEVFATIGDAKIVWPFKAWSIVQEPAGALIWTAKTKVAVEPPLTLGMKQ